MRPATLTAICALIAALALETVARADPTPEVSGTLLERIDSGGYSYLRLGTPAGEQWAAVPMTTLQKGAKVVVRNAVRMERFSSKTLNRTWDTIFFGELASAPAAAPAPAPAAAKPAPPLAGKVEERIDAGSYSYLRLTTERGEVWAAVPKTTVAAGTRVSVLNPAAMEGFESKTLGRKWDVIYFGSLGGAPEKPAKKLTAKQQKAAYSKVMGEHQKMTAGPGDVGDVKVDRALGPDARTVAEVWSQRATLADQKVSVRAKVIKVVPEVMGKTWLHLRDGSGSASAKDNDLTVTTKDGATVGDVVTVTGVVRVDRNFGASYSYPVIIEDATVSK